MEVYFGGNNNHDGDACRLIHQIQPIFCLDNGEGFNFFCILRNLLVSSISNSLSIEFLPPDKVFYSIRINYFTDIFNYLTLSNAGYIIFGTKYAIILNRAVEQKGVKEDFKMFEFIKSPPTHLFQRGETKEALCQRGEEPTVEYRLSPWKSQKPQALAFGVGLEYHGGSNLLRSGSLESC
jgi:hypothetical protein